ncbi:MAG TPA: hypothetical protein VI072_21430 [Polyangiaceae bacterium]
MSSPPVPPKRWARSDSDVGPVVQAVVRYAQNSGPSPARVEAIRQGVLAHGEGPRRRRRVPRAVLWAAALLVPSALVFGWLVAGTPHDAAPSLIVTKEPLARAPRKDPAPTPARELASSETSPPPSVPLAPKSAVSAPTPARRAEPEIETLQRARRLVSEKPAEALLITTQHAARHPRSEFTEEREALRIEALVRLDRGTEARRHFQTFAQNHPRSVYLRRMQPWFSGEPEK